MDDTMRRWLGPLVRRAGRLRVEGLEHVPTQGPVILASNHLSVLDSTFLPLAVPRRITFMAKAEYFTGTGLLDRATAVFMRRSGQVPVERGNQSAAVGALQTCLEVLRDGGAFCIYPEGTRSPDGRLYRARTGVAWLALCTGAPVVPTVMAGTDRMLPPGRVLPRPAQVLVRFGPPLPSTATTGDAADARARRRVADAVTAAIADLSGQERVRRYAAPAARGRLG